MTEIKICGITNREDALFAAHSGADALGFIFYHKSLRYIEPEEVRAIIVALPPEVIKVGVFVNHDADEVKRIKSFCGLDLLQLHGDEPPDYCLEFPPSLVIKAISPKKGDDLTALDRYKVKAFLVDARDGDQYGGTGLTSDWGVSSEVRKSYPLVLAGGLRAENIREAIAAVSPQAVDINSGIETAPGEKDHGKLKSIIEIIRSLGDKNEERKIFARE